MLAALRNQFGGHAVTLESRRAGPGDRDPDPLTPCPTAPSPPSTTSPAPSPARCVEAFAGASRAALRRSCSPAARRPGSATRCWRRPTGIDWPAGRRLRRRRACRAARRRRRQPAAHPRGAAGPGRRRRLVLAHAHGRAAGGVRRRLPAHDGGPAGRGRASTSSISGMGPDGHTASLFPGAPTLEAGPGVLVAGDRGPERRNPHPRLTLTLPAINSARVGGLHRVAAPRRPMRSPPAPRRRHPGRPGPRRHGRCGWSMAPHAALPPRLASMLSDADLLRTAARRPDRAGPRRARRGARAAGHVLAQGLHPADHAVPRPLRLLHLRQGAGARSPRPTSPPRRCWPSPGRGGRPAATRPSSPWASGPSCATRWRADWLAAHGHASTVDYLAAMCRLVVEETGLLPHANAGALVRRRAGAPAAGLGQPGDDARVAGRGSGGAPATHRTRSRPAGWPRWRRRASWPSPSPPGSWSGIGDDRADQLAALRAIAAAHARHGHVQEVIVQNFLPKPGHGHVPGRALPGRGPACGPSRRPGWCCRPRSTCRRRPTSPTTWRRCWRPASTTGAASRRSRPTT